MYKFKNKIKKKIFKIISKISEKLKYKTFLIGGYVRDLFLKIKKKKKDIDIVTTGNSLKLANFFLKKIFSKKFFIFKRFKTVIIKYKKYNLEFVSTRKEYYNIYNNKPYVKILKNLKEDQKRRDFTINTIAISLNKKNFGKIFDKYNGILDIKKKILKTPRNPNKTFFEDPLRMLRAIRFCTQFKFKMHKKIICSIKKNVERIKIISIERIIQEFNKILLSSKPSKGLKLMYKFNFLFLILPEFLNLKKKEKKNNFFYKDNFKHTLKVLDKISKYTKNLWLKWATLLHDIGKPISKKFNKKKGWTFYLHEIIGSNMIPQIFHRLKLPIKKNMEYVKKIIKYSNLPIILSKKNVKITTIKKYIFKLGLKLIKDIFLLCFCDITTKDFKKKYYLRKKIINIYKKIKKIEKKNKIYNLKIPVNGYDIIKFFKIVPSKIIGVIKRKIKKYIILGKLKNNYEDVIKFMKKKGKKIIKKYKKKCYLKKKNL